MPRFFRNNRRIYVPYHLMEYPSDHLSVEAVICWVGWQGVPLLMQISKSGLTPCDSTADEGVLAFATEQGKTYLLYASQLARLLWNHGSVRLAVLNACKGAKGGERDVFSSTASILARRGIPAILAMQEEITDNAAIECTRAFYAALAKSLPVDAAVAEARTAISLTSANTLEWGTPVLYLRAQSSTLFEIPSQALPLERSSPGYLPTLLVLSIDQSGPPKRVQVQAGSMTIGRREGNDLVVPDLHVSRRHLRLIWQEGAWQVVRQGVGPLLPMRRKNATAVSSVPGANARKVANQMRIAPVASYPVLAGCYHRFIAQDKSSTLLAQFSKSR